MMRKKVQLIWISLIKNPGIKDPRSLLFSGFFDLQYPYFVRGGLFCTILNL